MKKNISIISIAGIFIIGLMIVTSCNDSEHQSTTNDHHHEAGDEQTESSNHMEKYRNDASVNVPLSTTISPIVNAYMNISDALAVDDDEGASLAGKELFSALDGLDLSYLPKKERIEANDIIETARENAEHIYKNKGNIKHQREHLASLYADVNDLITIVGSDRQLYKLYCPMYNDNQGAMWMSSSDVVKNPFMGRKMQTCGKVKATISIK
ncbi:MAG: DUF3347 domain-containing protein [Candidatus Kuenenia stuttgartiensis]|nr:DUF3347 domain-containing protein [Candidatus Kuenenia stuttgartiensis]